MMGNGTVLDRILCNIALEFGLKWNFGTWMVGIMNERKQVLQIASRLDENRTRRSSPAEAGWGICL
jgi:hypothetical protein